MIITGIAVKIVAPLRGRQARSQDVHAAPVPPKECIKGRYYCDMCPLSFAYPGGLKTHENNNCPYTPKIYTCSFCSRALSNKQSKIDHESIHRTDHQYECPHCQHKLYSRSGIYHHQKKLCTALPDETVA